MSCVNFKVCNTEETHYYNRQVQWFTNIFGGILISEVLPWRCWGSYKWTALSSQRHNQKIKCRDFEVMLYYFYMKLIKLCLVHL